MKEILVSYIFEFLGLEVVYVEFMELVFKVIMVGYFFDFLNFGMLLMV